MKLKIKKALSFLTVCSLMALPMVVGAQFVANSGMDQSGLANTKVSDIIMNVMKWLLGILTTVAVIGFIISGFMFIIGGDAGKKEKAKSWLTYSIVGVVVGLIGYIAINLINTLLWGQVQQ